MSYMFEDGFFDVDCLPAPAEPCFLPGDEPEWYFDEELDLDDPVDYIDYEPYDYGEW